MKNAHTFGVMLSIWVLRLKVRVDPTADPCLLPTSTRMASAGLRKRLVNSTFRCRVDLGGMVTWSPLGTQKSLASWPATRTWYCKGLPLGLLSLTWCEKRNEQWDLKKELMLSISYDSQSLICGLDYLWRVLYLSTNCGMEATRKLDCCFWQELWDLLIEVNTQHQQSDGVRVCDVYGLQVKHDGNNVYMHTLAIVSWELYRE